MSDKGELCHDEVYHLLRGCTCRASLDEFVKALHVFRCEEPKERPPGNSKPVGREGDVNTTI